MKNVTKEALGKSKFFLQILLGEDTSLCIMMSLLLTCLSSLFLNQLIKDGQGERRIPCVLRRGENFFVAGDK